jgi:hypothetical protein
MDVPKNTAGGSEGKSEKKIGSMDELKHNCNRLRVGHVNHKVQSGKTYLSQPT